MPFCSGRCLFFYLNVSAIFQALCSTLRRRYIINTAGTKAQQHIVNTLLLMVTQKASQHFCKYEAQFQEETLNITL